MGKQTVSVMVEGGKATAAPPIGPTLAPLKININAVVSEINKKTEAMKGMQVPVKITVDDKDKSYTIEIGTPPVSALIRKEANLQKGSGKSKIEYIGQLKNAQVKKIAQIKFGGEDEAYLSQVIGTAHSMGVSIEGETIVLKKEKVKVEEAAAPAAVEAAPAAGAPAAPAAAAAPGNTAPPVPKKEEKKRKVRKGR